MYLNQCSNIKLVSITFPNLGKQKEKCGQPPVLPLSFRVDTPFRELILTFDLEGYSTEIWSQPTFLVNAPIVSIWNFLKQQEIVFQIQMPIDQ